MLQPLDSQDGCFMCVVQVHILDEAQEGAEDGLRTLRH
jgi:hypothetical protein